jgi:tetratricopeptide (TPR) repeat protein
MEASIVGSYNEGRERTRHPEVAVNARRILTVALALFALTALAPVAAQYISVEGEVVLEDGSPVDGATVILEPTRAGKATRTAKTRKKGTFKLGGVEFGDYRFSAEKDGLLIGHMDLEIIRNKQAERTESFDVGPDQVLPEFRIEPGREVVLKFTLVGKDHYAGVLTIPGNPKASRLLVDANNALGAGRHEEALAALEESAASADPDANVEYLTGRALFALGRMDEAVGHFERALELNPEMSGPNAQIGAIAYETGDKERAAEYFGRESVNSPGEVSLLINRAMILSEIGKTDEAIVAFESVIEVAPSEGPAYAELANLYQAAGREAEAVAVLEKMEQVSDPDPALWFNIGAGFANRELVEQAENAYRKALAIDSGFLPAVRELGYILLQKGDQAGALEQFRAYLAAAPDAPDAEVVRGLADYLAKASAEGAGGGS